MEWTAAAIRAISALLGSTVALVFRMPRTISEAWRRLVFSAVVGFLTGETLRTEYLHWPASVDNVVAATACAAAASWFAVPVALKVMQTLWPRPK